MFCEKCGSLNDNDAKFCKGCGVKLENERPTFCPKCGTKLDAYMNFCKNCGTKVTQDMKTAFADVANESFVMSELLSLANFCRTLSILRFIDAGVWFLLVISQMEYGGELGTIIWNIISIAITIGLAIGLLPGRYIEALRIHGKYDLNKLSSSISHNIGWSGIGLIWYAYQVLIDDVYISPIIILLEIAIIIVGAVAFIKTKFMSSHGLHTREP